MDSSSSMGGISGIVIIVIYIAIFALLMYFIAIRPQRKQQKKQDALLASIEVGGFYGVIIDITDEVVVVEFGNNKNCRIPMQKAAIVQVEKANSEE